MSFQFSVWRIFKYQTCYMWLHWEDRVRKYNPFFFLLLKVVFRHLCLETQWKDFFPFTSFLSFPTCDRMWGLIHGLLSDIVNEIHLT